MEYSLKLDQILTSLPNKAPKLLLHCCCAVCSGYVLDYLSDYFCIDMFYYNPNIYPQTEYQKRKAEQQRLIRETTYKNPVSYVDADYDYAVFLDAVKGLENEPEGGNRCNRCFALRLEKTAQYAAQQGGYDYIATTLTTSPHKNAMAINIIGEQLAEQAGQFWLPGNFKKRNGYLKATRLANEKNIYRQSYCGCQFSVREG